MVEHIIDRISEKCPHCDKDVDVMLLIKRGEEESMWCKRDDAKIIDGLIPRIEMTCPHCGEELTILNIEFGEEDEKNI